VNSVAQAKTRILVIEDDKDIREAVIEYLDMVGYLVTGAWNGQEAIEYLDRCQDPPHLILLDLMMPIMDGFQFREAQKAIIRCRDIPVVIMSADGNVEEKKLKVGANGYLKKPVDLDDLTAMIERFIG
jgi:two-component system, chemotaxis family, chemotaxis protein CheY